ncbi:neutral zinc metalloprotease [Streptomyces clavuligerus]|uniref:Neutral metalloproteinase n=2 Tax=Streptomyces clavuligerus TaxID=1901 RepID=E2Q7Q0_STRCL|nr:neutral zinc metalloprotease [Streptomyces clavuligerus]
MIAVGVQAGVPASAAPADRAGAAFGAAVADADPGALPQQLTPAQRTGLIRAQSATTGETARELGLGPQEKLLVREVARDRDGTVHTRYERTYAGLPVLGGDLVVASAKDGAVTSVVKASRTALRGVATTARVTPATAEKQARARAVAQKASGTETEHAPRKVVWLAQGSKPVLAYETVVGGTQPDGTPNELHVVTDATTGAKLYEWQAVHNGTGHTQYSGQVTLGSVASGGTFNLTDTARGNHRTHNLNRGTTGTGALFSGPDDIWGNGLPADAETAGADAAYGAGLTWDYFKNVHGRNGIKNDGVGAYSRVHYGNNYVNAFWTDSCFCMTYGDGAGNAKPLTSIDVAAHEMTHGVTSNTAGLIYSGESGGLNEATSDIFAAAVEFHANNAQDPGDYLVGEKIDIRGNGTPLRYMDRPSRDGSSKDYWYSGIGSIGVHSSSGVGNHWFYLASEGSGPKTVNGVSYDSPTYDGQPVTPIGRDKAALIWYRALTTKFTTTTNYAAARAGTIAAATELYGAGSPEVTNITHAWAAVNVGARPGGGGNPGGPSFENTADVAIPDNGAAVTSPVAVTGVAGNAPSNLAVDVDIVHTWRGDLQVDLVAPDGTVYPLKPLSPSDSGDDVREIFTVNASSEVANGTWGLRVQDRATADTGYINSVKLTF